MRNESQFAPSRRAPVAVVLGTNDVASAVGCALFAAGYGVVLSRDPAQPVLRRRMALDDAIEAGVAELEGVEGRAAENLVHIMRGFIERSCVCVTVMELGDLLCLGLIDVLVDARMRLHALKVDVRPFARHTIGLGPGFTAGRHVGVAIETAPEAVGEVIAEGSTIAAHGRSSELGGAGRERFARAPGGGLWLSAAAIGDRVREGDLIGTCGGEPVLAPLDGRLRGLVRTGILVQGGYKLVEVDPRPEGIARWVGIAERPGRIAAATLEGLRFLQSEEAGPSLLTPSP